jgi:DNA-binding GntR family transcriptional regulator
MADFRTTSLADQVFEKLEKDILLGVYPRGEVLTELKLAEQLGVSRTPIREALRRLEQERLIADTGKGSMVLGLTPENLMDIMDIRIRIEPMAAYYATVNQTPEGIAELQHIIDLQEFYCTRHDVSHLLKEDDTFHGAICKMCGRSVLQDILEPLIRKTSKYRQIAPNNHGQQQRSYEGHRNIFQAIVSGDADLAAQLTASHIEQAKKNMIERYEHIWAKP